MGCRIRHPPFESSPSVQAPGWHQWWPCLNWSLKGYGQRQLHNTEAQTELKLHTAIDDHGFLLTNLKEDSVKLEKLQKGW